MWTPAAYIRLFKKLSFPITIVLCETPKTSENDSFFVMVLEQPD